MMQTATLRPFRVLLIMLAFSSASFMCEGCSTVHVKAKQASKTGDIQSETVWALFWGASDPVKSVDCRTNGLQVVSMQTNWLYSLCSFITLGAVVPVDIEYRCTAGKLQGGGDIGEAPLNNSNAQGANNE